MNVWFSKLRNSPGTTATKTMAVATRDYEASRPEASILSGYVIYEDTGKGIGGVKIELNAASGAKIGATVSGPNGKFAFRDLPAGRYSIRASKNAYEPTGITQSSSHGRT